MIVRSERFQKTFIYACVRPIVKDMISKIQRDLYFKRADEYYMIVTVCDILCGDMY
jgi:hypothetical protein